MWQFLHRLWRASKHLIDHDGFEVSGYVAYTMIFAIFPFMIFLTALAGFLGSADVANRAIDVLFSNLPADVAKTLAPPIRDVLTHRKGGLLGIGILATLWSASSGIEALRLSLNRAYGCPEVRPFWLRRLQSLVFVVVGSVAVLLVSILIIAGPALIELVSSYVYVSRNTKIPVLITNYVVGILIVNGGLLALHKWLPARRMNVRELWPGVAFSAGLMLTAASLFSVYLALAGNMSVTYGGLGGMVLTLLFFYVGGVMFSFGAEFNAAAVGYSCENETAKTDPDPTPGKA